MGQKQSPVKGAPLCSHHRWRLRTASGLLKGTWEGQGLSRTGQGRHFLLGAATVNCVNRICNPESGIKQLSPKAAFYSSQFFPFFFFFFWAKGVSQPWELDRESILSLIRANIEMEPWDGHWWAPMVGGNWLCLESEFSCKKGMRRKEKHKVFFFPLLRQSIYEGGINTK